MSTPNVAVIPTAGARLDLLQPLVTQLGEEGVHTIVIDTTHRVRPLKGFYTHMLATGVGIHSWWNQTWDHIVAHQPNVNIAFLNDDIRMAPEMVHDLGRELRDHPDVGVIAPSRSIRPGYLRDCEQIATGEYLDTGLPGWAFMVRSETPYRFPTDMTWWFGDNDLLITALKHGSRVCLLNETWCEHVDGGSQTGKWDDPDMQKVLKRDLEAFLARHGRVMEQASARTPASQEPVDQR